MDYCHKADIRPVSLLPPRSPNLLFSSPWNSKEGGNPAQFQHEGAILHWLLSFVVWTPISKSRKLLPVKTRKSVIWEQDKCSDLTHILRQWIWIHSLIWRARQLSGFWYAYAAVAFIETKKRRRTKEQKEERESISSQLWHTQSEDLIWVHKA